MVKVVGLLSGGLPSCSHETVSPSGTSDGVNVTGSHAIGGSGAHVKSGAAKAAGAEAQLEHEHGKASQQACA